MKKRFLIPLAYRAALGFLIVYAVGSSSCAIYHESPINANELSRIGPESMSYITPECLSVKEALQDILGDPPYEPSQLGFDDIRDWVASNIAYKSDEERWRKDCWQTPEETLSYRTGDCEDFSILLCSLFRAYGIDAERVYVALGVDGEEDGHAFLIEDWYHQGEWRRIEAQAPARLLPGYSYFGLLKRHPDSELNKYEIITAFNDLYYYDESFSSNEVQEDTGTLAKMLTAIVDIAQRLSQLLQYLLGLLFD
jgi:hypothetical protein